MNALDVLVVDDEEPILTMASEFLQARDLQATSAENGEQALRMLEERARGGQAGFAAVVSDWIMPVMDGLTLLDKMRSGEFQSVPFVLMSGAVTKEVLLGAVKHDPDAILLKPFSMDALFAKIQEAVKARERKELGRAVDGSRKP